MWIKSRIYVTLENTEFPDLKFLYSPEALSLALSVLDDLLEQEKQDFSDKLKTPDSEINFDTFQDFSKLDYFFSLLEHYQGVHGDDVIRNIIEEFEPRYIDFWNEVAYSKRYYDMLNICIQSWKLNPQEERIIQKSIDAFELRGIALDDRKQSRLKEISKKLSEISQKFSNNVVDDKKNFEYVITDEKLISEMPEDDRDIAKKRYEDKYGIKQAMTEVELKKCFQFFQKMWKEEFQITLRYEQFERFKKNEVFYIGGEHIFGCIQITSIDDVVLKYDSELIWVANVWEKLLGRIGVQSLQRGKWIGSKLIKYVQHRYASQWETKMFLPSAIENTEYYNKFSFVAFAEPAACWNTKKVMMKVSLKKYKNLSSHNYLFDASQGSYMSIMKYCSDSEVRKHFYQSRHAFATQWEYNNKALILETLELRQEKATLLGFENYSELSLKFKMAESTDQIIGLFSDISLKARPKAQAELDEISDYFDIHDIQNWDLSYYANKLREEKYAFDSKVLKQYLRFEDVLEWMFQIIYKLYGLEMKKLDTQSYNEDVAIYEVSRNGEFVSYFFTDYFYNELKRPGAWANMLREKYMKNAKIVLNVCNFQKWADGSTLLTLWDVETMFHEFGHATHEMLSRSEYSDLSWFHVEWDFIELPSQLLENWCREKAWLDIFARHHTTGEKIPNEMLEKMKQLDTFWNGQMILLQNTYAMMDMKLHSESIPESQDDLDARVIQNYADNALLPMWDIYSPHTTFTHIFDGWYAAGYYSYMWAEIIEKEVWRAFKDSGDIFSPEVSGKFHDSILSVGTTKKASELFRDFFGRDVEIWAFLSEKWLV